MTAAVWLRCHAGAATRSLIREFDLGSCDFVRDGFVIAEAKTEVVWRDLDTLYVASDFGPGR